MQGAACLAAILALAAALRLAGLHWGLPQAGHPDYSYHPDEMLPIVWAQWLAQGRLIAKHFMYGGTLHYTLLNVYRYYGAMLGGANALAATILFGRYCVTAASLLNILLVQQTGKLLFGAAAGMLAALLLAIAPGHVFLAQNVRPDELGTLLASVQVYLGALILRGVPERDRAYFLIAGLALGAATALRFPLAVFGMAPAAAFVLRGSAAWGRELLRILRWRLPLFAAAACAGYAVASPQSLLHFDWLLRGLQVQRDYQSMAFPDAVDRGPQIYQYGCLMLREALGYPLYALALAGVALACARPSPARLLILLPALGYFLPLLLAHWVVVRYTLQIVPLLLLLAADLAVVIIAGLRNYRWAVRLALAVAVAWTLLADLAFAGVESGRNVRELAADWLQNHVPPGAAVVEVQQYSGDVYLNPVIPAGFVQQDFDLKADPPDRLLSPGSQHDYLVLSGAAYLNMDRLGARNPQPGAYALQQVLDGGHYRRVAEIVVPVRFLGLDFSSGFTSQDYQIINPGERIYRFEP